MLKTSNRESFSYACLEWLWVIGAVLVYGSSLILPARLFVIILDNYGLGLSMFFMPLGVYLFLAVLILILGILHNLFPQVKEGKYPLKRSREVTIWTIQAGINNFVTVPGFNNLIRSNPLLRRLYYKLIGAKIHTSALISYDVSIIDPFLVEIDEGVKIGRWAKLLGHIADEKHFTFGKIKIEKNVLVGGECIIGPGVVIGEGSVITGRSSVLPYTVIPSGEMWAGTPARFRKKNRQ